MANNPTHKVTVEFSPSETSFKGSLGFPMKKPTDTVVSQLMGYPTKDSGILPPVVRSFSNNMRNFIVERTPFFARINYKNCKARGLASHQVLEVPIPWTVYQISLNELMIPFAVSIWMRPSQIYSEDDGLYFLPMPNYYDGGLTCLGGGDFPSLVNLSETPTISSAISMAINAFWTSSFNTDLEYFMMAGYNDPLRKKAGHSFNGGLDQLKFMSTLSMEDMMDPADFEPGGSGKLVWKNNCNVKWLIDNLDRSSNVPKDGESLVNWFNFVGGRSG